MGREERFFHSELVAAQEEYRAVFRRVLAMQPVLPGQGKSPLSLTLLRTMYFSEGEKLPDNTWKPPEINYSKSITPRIKVPEPIKRLFSEKFNGTPLAATRISLAEKYVAIELRLKFDTEGRGTKELRQLVFDVDNAQVYVGNLPEDPTMPLLKVYRRKIQNITEEQGIKMDSEAIRALTTLVSRVSARKRVDLRYYDHTVSPSEEVEQVYDYYRETFFETLVWLGGKLVFPSASELPDFIERLDREAHRGLVVRLRDKRFIEDTVGMEVSDSLQTHLNLVFGRLVDLHSVYFYDKWVSVKVYDAEGKNQGDDEDVTIFVESGRTQKKDNKARVSARNVRLDDYVTYFDIGIEELTGLVRLLKEDAHTNKAEIIIYPYLHDYLVESDYERLASESKERLKFLEKF